MSNPPLAGKRKMSGPLALSPLLIFLSVYLISSLVAGDFYKVPVTAAFLFASVYALAITRGGRLAERIDIFSRGAGDKNVLVMIWIFVFAGAFAATAKDIGAIDATVNLTLSLLPGRFLYAGLFIAACFISFAIGTSVGTIVALVPIASAIAGETGLGVAAVTAIITGGAFFGDNLSFISDTTVASTKTQGCSMKDKFKANAIIAGIAAVIVLLLYLYLGWGVQYTHPVGSVQPVKLLPYVLVIGLALAGINVIATLAAGILANGILGFAYGIFDWTGWFVSAGNGISGMGELIIVTLLAGGMLEIIRHNGGMDYIVGQMTRRLSGRRGAELSIAAMVCLVNFCTANNTIAILTAGPIAKDVSGRFGISPRRTASLLDTFSCFVQGIIPYGAQMLMASGLAAVASTEIIAHLYYPFVLGGVALLAILFPLKFRKRLSLR